jgi:hypothetical protein
MALATTSRATTATIRTSDSAGSSASDGRSNGANFDATNGGGAPGPGQRGLGSGGGPGMDATAASGLNSKRSPRSPPYFGIAIILSRELVFTPAVRLSRCDRASLGHLAGAAAC